MLQIEGVNDQLLNEICHFYCAIYRHNAIDKLAKRLNGYRYLPPNQDPPVGFELCHIPKKYYNNAMRVDGTIEKFNKFEIQCRYHSTKHPDNPPKTRIVSRENNFLFYRPKYSSVVMLESESEEESSLDANANANQDKFVVILEDNF